MKRDSVSASCSIRGLPLDSGVEARGDFRVLLACLLARSTYGMRISPRSAFHVDDYRPRTRCDSESVVTHAQPASLVRVFIVFTKPNQSQTARPRPKLLWLAARFIAFAVSSLTYRPTRVTTTWAPSRVSRFASYESSPLPGSQYTLHICPAAERTTA